jgi:hypothetical protein
MPGRSRESSLERNLMLLNPRSSQEVPGTDKAGNPCDPVRYIELIVIPAAAKMDPSLTIFKLTRKQQSLVLPLAAELRNALRDCSRKRDWGEAMRLYVDTHRAILRIPHPGLRAWFCKRVKQLEFTHWLRPHPTRVWRGPYMVEADI